MDCLGSTNSGQFSIKSCFLTYLFGRVEKILEWEGPWTFDAYDFYDEEVLATAAIEAIYAEGLSLTFQTYTVVHKVYGIDYGSSWSIDSPYFYTKRLVS